MEGPADALPEAQVKLKVILLGPPGAGKGTQAERLAESLGVPRVSSGELFRDHQQRDTKLGRLARSYMERGALVPDDVTISMVKEWIDDHQDAGGPWGSTGNRSAGPGTRGDAARVRQDDR